MSSFTITLKETLQRTGGHIGLDKYPIFDEYYRRPLNGKIIDRYLNREIGQETVDMFQLAMRRKMNEIMPYYNQLYSSELLRIDPFLTFQTESDNTQEAKNANQSQGTNASTSEGKSRTVASETPQTRLAGDEDYASSAQDSASESVAQGEASDSSSGTTEGVTHSTARGFSGAMADLLIRYRETFLNVDLMVVEELDSLFMQVWDMGDEFSRTENGYFGGYGYPLFGGF